MYLLFTTPTCPNCPQAKTFLEHHSDQISARFVDASTPDGLSLARQYDVAQVPTLLEVEEEVVLGRYSGLESIRSLIT